MNDLIEKRDHPVRWSFIVLGLIIAVLFVMGVLTSGETRVSQTAILNGTPDRVWPFFADLRGWPTWYRADDGTRMTYSVLSKGTTSNLGAVRHAEESFGSWWQEQVVAYEVEKRLELRGVMTGRRHGWRQEIVLEPQPGDKTKVTWTLEYSVRGPIFKLLNRSQTEDQFRNYMEAGLRNIDLLIPTPDEWGASPGATTAPAPPPSASTSAPPPAAKEAGSSP